MTKKQLTIGIIALLVIAAGLALVVQQKMGKRVGPQETAETPKKAEVPIEDGSLRVGTIANSIEASFLIDFAQEKGMFEQKNLKVEVVTTDKNPTALLTAGGADVTAGGIGGVLESYLNGSPLVWIASPYRAFNYVGFSRYAQGDIGKIRKVVVNRMGGDNQVSAMLALKNLGVNLDSVEFVAVPSIAGRISMLEKGEADFTIADADWNPESEASKAAKKFSTYAPKEMLNGVLRGVFSSRKTLLNKPQTITKFLAVYYNVLGYAGDHESEVVAFLQKKYGFTQEGAEKFYSEFVLAKEGVVFMPSEISLSDAAEIIKGNLNPTNKDRALREFIDSIPSQEALVLAAQ